MIVISLNHIHALSSNFYEESYCGYTLHDENGTIKLRSRSNYLKRKEAYILLCPLLRTQNRLKIN
jgi:hypothetical protein